MVKTRMKGEERRRQIINTAVGLFAQRGFVEVTTREIAAAAGINEATIYKYFKSKDDLFGAVIKYYGDKVLARALTIKPSGSDDVRSVFTELALAVVRFIKEEPNLLRLMLYSGLQNHPFSEMCFGEIGIKILTTLEESFTQAQAKGVIRAELDPVYSTLPFLGMLVHYCLGRFIVLKEPFEPLEEERYIRNLVDIYLNGILREPNGEQQ